MAPSEGLKAWRSYRLRDIGVLSAGELAAVELVAADVGPEVDLTLSPVGTDKLAALTTAHVGHRLAMVVDGRVLIDAVIQEPIRGGRLRVTCGSTLGREAIVRQCSELAQRLGRAVSPVVR